MTFFEGLQEKKANFIWRIHEQFLNDTSNQKVDLTVGAYRDNNGKPYVFKAIKNAEHQILNDEKIFKEYTGPEGVPLFDELAQKFLFGDCISYREGRIATVQSIAGTGSLKLCADFLKANFYNKIKKVYISDPTWIPHRIIFEAAGFLVEDYPYYSKETATVMINEMIEKFYAADNNSLVILHPCAHNPTGLDLTEFEWKQIAQTIKEKNLMVLFDIAYQGFASGSTDEDAWPVRYFEKMGFEFLVTQSFSKNMGLYGERIGALHMVCNDTKTKDLVLQNINHFVSLAYTAPPIHGGYIVKTVLENPEMTSSWKAELKTVAERMKEMRHSFVRGMMAHGTPGNWDAVLEQKGMFSYLPLTESQCYHLIQHWHIYLLPNGRISIAGLNSTNIQYVIDAVDDTVRNVNSGS